MPLMTYQCSQGHQVTVDRDQLTSATIDCPTCHETIDRFNSKNIVHEVDASTGEIRQVVVPDNRIANFLKKYKLNICAAVFGVALSAAISLAIVEKDDRSQEPPQVVENQIEDIAYQQYFVATEESGVYKIEIKMSNMGDRERNHLPMILVEFMKLTPGANGAMTATPVIPTAVFKPEDYAPDQLQSMEFVTATAQLEIQLPVGTDAAVTCLTYIGASDMKSERCIQNVNEVIRKAAPAAPAQETK